MKSIFNADNNAELINRIDQLTANTPALWGKMNPAQMMAHCQASMNVALGNSKMVRHWIGIICGNFSKRRMLRVTVFDRHMPTFKKFEITDDRDFGLEKEKFTALIKSAHAKGPSALVKYPHPYFRKLKDNEWVQLNWNHLDHHLRQFGV